MPAPAKIGQERRPAWIIAGGTGGLGLEIAEALAIAETQRGSRMGMLIDR
ncbi:MAG: hypothetical protein AAFY56_06090 [Pseudomonadota bacterium]